MNFIRKIFEDKVDGETHNQFQRFSKGVFENRALIDVTKTSKGGKIATSFEFVNYFVKLLLNSKEIRNLNGVILGTTDLRKLGYDFGEVKQFMGVKKFDVKDLTREQLIDLMEKATDSLFLLSFECENGNLKTKTKPPKSGKNSDKEQKADFCTLYTNNKEIIEDFLFDIKKDFSKVKTRHTFIIDEIIVPDKYKNDSAMARKQAIRKGKIIRYIDIDGILEEKQKDLGV